LLALFAACQKPLYLQQSDSKYYSIQKYSAVDSNMTKMLQPYKTGIDTQMFVVIGRTDIPLTKAQPESTLGNFMADAQLTAAKKVDNKVVASVINYGGIRLAYIAPGPITRGKIYEIMPFDNVVTIIEIPGEVLKSFCDHMAQSKGWPVSGLRYIIKDKKADSVTITGQPVNDNIIYKIAVPDYIAKGGDNCEFLMPLNKRNTGVFVREAMMEYVMHLEQQNIALHPNLERRVKHVE
jgi:2',3'-cyclic-nucleotide 2'-phosphodiesterase (5'-nucleotidase family)